MEDVACQSVQTMGERQPCKGEMDCEPFPFGEVLFLGSLLSWSLPFSAAQVRGVRCRHAMRSMPHVVVFADRAPAATSGLDFSSPEG